MKASREQILKLAGYFRIPEKELLKEWLSDKVLYRLQDEEMGLEALKMAEAQWKYSKRK